MERSHSVWRAEMSLRLISAPGDAWRRSPGLCLRHSELGH